MLKLLTILTFMVFVLQARSQNYPVQVVPQLVAPYSLSLSDYYSGTVPKLYVTITNRDLLQPSLQVKLRVTINGSSVQVKSNPSAYYPAITLDAGIPQRLLQNDLEPYFNPANLDFQGMNKSEYLKQGKLPEGLYSFCFEVVEVNTNRVLSRSECATAWISLSDPPLLNTPSDKSSILAKEPTNIVFNWTPRHLNSPNGAYNSEYEFQLIEIWDNAIDPQAVFNTTRVLYSATTQATTLLYGVAEPQLFPGKKYAWRVKVKPKTISDDKDEFKNGGYSNIYSFTYLFNCLAPTEIEAKIGTSGGVTLSWNAPLNINEFEIAYVEKGIPGATWVYKTVTNTRELNITGLKPGSSYGYYVGSVCNGGNVTSSGTKTFDMPKQTVAVGPPKIMNSVEGKGRVFLESDFGGAAELNNTSILSSTFEKDQSKDILPSTKNKTPMSGISVLLYRMLVEKNSSEFGPVSSTTTDENGNFTINYDPKLIVEGASFTLFVMHPSGDFKRKLRIRLPLNATNGKIDFTNAAEAIFKLNTFHLTPRVYAPDVSPANASGLSVDILLEKESWNKSYGIYAKILGLNANNIVKYNNQNYVLVTTLMNGNVYKKLLLNNNTTANYIARINYTTGPSKFEELPKQETAASLTHCFEYDLRTHVSGVVSSNEKPVSGARIYVGIQTRDIVGGLEAVKMYKSAILEGYDTSYIEFLTTTDNSGAYHFDNIPKFRVGCTVNLRLIDFITIWDKIVITDATKYIKNFNLRKKIVTYFGRIKDQDDIPVANALVSINGNSESVRTTQEGYYMIKSEYSEDKSVTVSADGYSSATTPLSAFEVKRAYNPKNLEDSIYWWQSIQTLNNRIDESDYNTPTTADLFGIGTGRLFNVFSKYFNLKMESVAGIGGHNFKLQNTNGMVKMSINFKGKKINALVHLAKVKSGKADSLPTRKSIENEDWKFSASSGTYNFSITPYDINDKFVEFFGEFTLNERKNGNDNGSYIKIDLKEGIILSGHIISNEKEKKLKDVRIEFEGSPIHSETNSDGNYSIIVEKNSYQKLHISKDTYTSLDTAVTFANANTTINLTLIYNPQVPITKLSGFEVKLDKQVFSGTTGIYILSGKLILPSNDVFKTTSGNDKLTFKDISVKAESKSENAIPTADVVFEEAIIQSYAFGYAPVEIKNPHLSKLTTASVGDYTIAVITGEDLTARLATLGNASAIPVKLRDAKLTEQANNNYVYISPGNKINAFAKTKVYNLQFIENPLNNISTPNNNIDFIEANILPKVSIYIEKKKATLDENGVNMNGYFQIPNELSKGAENNGKIIIQKFSIKKDLRSYDLSFAIGVDRPVFLPLQKITAKLTRLDLVGLGSTNCGVGFGGDIWLMKKEKTSTDKEGVLTIKELSLINKSEGLTFTGEFSLPSEGVSIKSILFTTPGTTIGITYNFKDHGFTLDAAGVIEYKGTSENKILKAIPKIEIQKFSLRSKDWGLFLVAKPNIKINYKVVTVNVEKLLINVGYGMSLDAMNTYLTSDNVPAVNTGNADEPVDESKVSWALGISGGIEFPIKQLNVSVSASVLVGNIDNQIQARLNEIALRIENPAFILAAKVNLKFSGRETGFAAEAQLSITGMGEVKAAFHYFNVADSGDSKGGFKLGAALAYTSTLPLTIAPVLPVVDIYGLGGGFNLNTVNNIFEVFLSGKFTAAGTPKTTAYLDVARIGIIFSTNDCGPKPVMEGEASLYIKEKPWGTIQAKVDFCKAFLFITINGQVPILPELLPTIGVQGVLYADAMRKSLFLGVNANFTSTLVSGNALISLGGNYKYETKDSRILDNLNASQGRTAPLVDIKTFWDKIPATAKDNDGSFSGIYLSAAVNLPGGNGGYSNWFVDCSYGYNGSGDADLGYKFKSNEFFFSANVKFQAWGDAHFIGISAHGDVKLDAGLAGGKNNEGWWANGSVEGRMNVRAGSDNVQENDWRNSFSCNTCWKKLWIIGWVDYDCDCEWISGFKVNKAIEAYFKYRPGKPIAASAYFK